MLLGGPARLTARNSMQALNDRNRDAEYVARQCEAGYRLPANPGSAHTPILRQDRDRPHQILQVIRPGNNFVLKIPIVRSVNSNIFRLVFASASLDTKPASTIQKLPAFCIKGHGWSNAQLPSNHRNTLPPALLVCQAFARMSQCP